MAEVDSAKEKIAYLRGLRAVRQFRDEAIPDEILHDILEVARWSGSASNLQPWELLIVKKRETLQALAQVGGYAGHLAHAALAIILVRNGDLDRVGPETYDEGRLSERIMLAAAAYEVGSCIGSFTDNGGSEVKKLLHIPAHRIVHTAISLGYPDEAAIRARPKRPQARKPLNEIVHYESYEH